MRKWLYDNPWIWIVLFLGSLVTGSLVTVVIAEMNKPEIVKVKPTQHSCGPHSEAHLRIA